MRVVVWPTMQALRAYFRASGYTRTYVRDMQAICCPMTVRRYRTRSAYMTGLVAEVHFHRDYLGVGVISHEMFHATMAWAERDGSTIAEHEEYLAQILQELVRITAITLWPS